MKGPIKANIWTYWGVADALCITTNGSVKSNGELVMGRGIALEAAQRFPGMAYHLGRKVKHEGHRACVIPGTTIPMGTPSVLVSLPTKPGDRCVSSLSELLPQFRTSTRVGSVAPGWKFLTTPELLGKSLQELVDLTDLYEWESVILTPPGARNGGLDLALCLEICGELLDDRFTVVTQ
jgi:hypothetical protein